MPTILGFDKDEPGKLLGFGSWGHVDAYGNAGMTERHIEISFFGIHVDYKGEALASGDLCADHLFATVLRDALEHDDSSDKMPVTLACHRDNCRAMRFWRRQGFREAAAMGLRVPGAESEKYRRLVLGKRP